MLFRSPRVLTKRPMTPSAHARTHARAHLRLHTQGASAVEACDFLHDDWLWELAYRRRGWSAFVARMAHSISVHTHTHTHTRAHTHARTHARTHTHTHKHTHTKRSWPALLYIGEHRRMCAQTHTLAHTFVARMPLFLSAKPPQASFVVLCAIVSFSRSPAPPLLLDMLWLDAA